MYDFFDYYCRYFMNLVQQSGDIELLGLLHSSSNQNVFNPQNLPNITILIPQPMSIQQLGSGQELSTVNKNKKE